MKPERWEQIERLYHSALEREPGERESFIDQACAGDDELRREISSLLAHDRSGDSFIAAPVLADAAQLMAGATLMENTVTQLEAPAVAREIGPYKLQTLLGRGGMGEVYLAFDPRLSRRVALKLLPEDSNADPEIKRRFAQEARAASALNHPNIITIYEIGSDQQRDFIAMEYVEGEPLRGLLERGKIDFKRSLELVAQCASGLAAAHEAGIIHRDIKPENLMVARATNVKILDFGLAKLVEKQRPSLGMSDMTTKPGHSPGAQDGTTPGAILGTVAYMSPEQAAGGALDHRTDIFSLGLVLYEALTGQRAFQGRSAVDVLHAIINDEPRPAVQVNPRLPAEVTEILGKALAKEPGERYQHAGDFELDLRRLKRAIESRSSQSDRAQPVIKPGVRRKAVMWGIAGVLIMASVFAGWMLGRSTVTQPSAGAPGPLVPMTITPLTTDPGYAGEPTFSPDGQTIAYVSNRTGNFEIFRKQISGGAEINLTNNAADDAQPAFSPDGSRIAFVSTRESSSQLIYRHASFPLLGGDIWVMPALSGSARRIVQSGNFPAWSPDGSSIIYVSGPHTQELFSVPASGGEAREISLKFKADDPVKPSLLYPSYSSNGQWIVFETQLSDLIYVVGATGGEPRRIAKGRRPVWNADSTAIIYSSGEPGKNYSLWQVAFAPADGKVVGEPSPLTVSRGRDTQAAVSRDGRLVAFAGQDVEFNIEKLPFDAESGRQRGAPQTITSGRSLNYFFDFAPDGRAVVFESHRGAGYHIWRANETGLDQLTYDENFDDQNPRWSPDGRAIAFTRKRVEQPIVKSSLWLVAADGGNPHPLFEEALRFRWMPDGRRIVFYSPLDKQFYLLDLPTKSKQRLTNELGALGMFTISPDGQWVVYQSSMKGDTVDVRTFHTSGGPSRAIVETSRQDYHPFVSPSGKWLYFQPDHKNLYRVPGPAQQWRQAEPEKVTNFPESGLFLEDPQISRDGRWFLYSRGRITSDIWIMKLGQ